MSIDPMVPITLPAFIVYGVPAVLVAAIVAQYHRINSMADRWETRLAGMLEDARHERIERDVTRPRR